MCLVSRGVAGPGVGEDDRQTDASGPRQAAFHVTCDMGTPRELPQQVLTEPVASSWLPNSMSEFRGTLGNWGLGPSSWAKKHKSIMSSFIPIILSVCSPIYFERGDVSRGEAERERENPRQAPC